MPWSEVCLLIIAHVLGFKVIGLLIIFKSSGPCGVQANINRCWKYGNKHLFSFFFCRCDADPSALANYVVALVKKDKPEKELRALCADQLDVFLQKGNAA